MFKNLAWKIISFLQKRYPRLTEEEWGKILSTCEKSKALGICKERELPFEDSFVFSGADTKIYFEEENLALVTQFYVWKQGNETKGSLEFVGFPKSDHIGTLLGKRGRLSLVVGCLNKDNNPVKKVLFEEEVLFSSGYEFCLNTDDICTNISINFEIIKPIAQG